MIRAKIGTCSGCGLGVTLPHTQTWTPGKVVVVIDEADLTEEQLQRLYLREGLRQRQRELDQKLIESLPPRAPRRHIFMVKPQWEEKIRRGHKTSTIRPLRKRKPVEGDIAEFRVWTGKPYRSKQRIIGEAVISLVDEIEMSEDGVEPLDENLKIRVGYIDDTVAAHDGFLNYAALWQWFRQEYGQNLASFQGMRTCWERKTLRLHALQEGGKP
jgi:hypothetical protein